MRNFVENVKAKAYLAAVPVFTAGAMLAAPVSALAAETGDTGVAATMESAFTSVQADFTAVVGKVAPIGIAIFGVFLIWKLGMKFFKNISHG